MRERSLTELSGNYDVKMQDRRRGHRFSPPKDVLSKIPALYTTEDSVAAAKIVYVHYFTGSCDWYIVELDPETGIAFGYADLGDPQNAEWGYVDLTELGTVEGPFGIGVERDLHWTPKRFDEVR